MLKPTVAAAEFEKYGFKRCKGKQYEECYYLCVAHGCVMLFVSDVCFDIFKWDEADPRIHKEKDFLLMFTESLSHSLQENGSTQEKRVMRKLSSF